jgi:signal transduction histidine kinase
MMDKIALPSNTETFGFHFSDLSFQNVNPRFQYRLFPYENIWRGSDNITFANYYRIPPGTYTFQVKAQQKSAVLNSQITELGVVILPPWWMTGWAYSLFVLIFILGVLLTHRVQKARVIRKERERTKEKELEQAKVIEKAYTELKTTQAQLIHSEKMASLGELTAGIAHEIQNPLNFVKNFSEVNTELIDELKAERSKLKGERDEKLEEELIKDIRENELKIIEHGNRADAIVKGMLQHSGANSAEKEPTDINTLADEYLRLAYHGLRAKDKSFNSDFNLELDKNLPKIKVIPQDIGRVLLNLINNAFYAVDKKTKHPSPEASDVKATENSNYKPQVSVSTKKTGDIVEIRVKDNGDGIPEHVRNKIFQPFFTTKPTGSGTGLGLSLSYDIVKAHGGELKVETKENKGSEFIIVLGINTN